MGSEWREHPKLKHRLLPDYPDDLRVIVHDGGPRVSSNPAEVVWVTVIGMDGEVFRGRVLNQPVNLRSVRQGNEINFIIAEGAEFPVMATEKYLRERGDWVIHPCQNCGLSELFDAPSDLIGKALPKPPGDPTMSMFTSVCPLCGGVQGAQSKGNPEHAEEDPAPAPRAVERAWWRFW